MDSLFKKITHSGVKKSDSEDLRIKKVALTTLPFYIFFPALLWSAIYIYLGYYEASYVPISYIVISLISTFILYKSGNFAFFEMTQLVLILILPFLLMWILGGFLAGSFVMIWSFFAPTAAMMYSENIRSGLRWFFAFLLLMLFSVYIDDQLLNTITHKLPQVVVEAFFALNIGAGFSGIFFLMSQFIKNIKNMSDELKSDRETLFKLTNDLRSANKELEHLATCDVVTELPNRLYFQDIVYDMFKRASMNDKIVAIMFLDLDGFKTINDTLGHEAGDYILKVVGSRLRSVVRSSDTVARVGGDEFAIAIGDIGDVNHVREIAKVLIKEVNEFCPYNDENCHVGVSIGISFYPEHGNNIEELMQKADKAMYDIKKTGKNSYSIYKEE